jgi:hypothetical protein
LQFEHVFAGVRRWTRKIKQDAAIDQLSVAIAKRSEVRMTRYRFASQHGAGDRWRMGTRNTNRADTGRAGTRGDGCDGVFTVVHGLPVDSEAARLSTRRPVITPSWP